jgi:hypothetical protein
MSGLYFGYDPGGGGAHGVALIDNAQALCGTVPTAQHAIDWLCGHCGGRSTRTCGPPRSELFTDFDHLEHLLDMQRSPHLAWDWACRCWRLGRPPTGFIAQKCPLSPGVNRPLTHQTGP